MKDKEREIQNTIIMNNSNTSVSSYSCHKSVALFYLRTQKLKKNCLRDRGSQWNCAAEHDCHRNWENSSKAMELDVAVSLAKPLQQEGVELRAPVADDDAATIERLKEEMDVVI